MRIAIALSLSLALMAGGFDLNSIENNRGEKATVVRPPEFSA
jgi:hypothetical protein